MSQYIQITFRENGKPYTYVNPGLSVRVGDKVQIDSRDGLVTVPVVAILENPPKFDCKPIAGVVQ